jgi:hypothetical protein
MTRFRLRSLMILIVLVAVGLWVAVTISRIWTAVSMLQNESGGVLKPAYVILVLAVITALSLIVVGVIALALRIRRVLRASSRGSRRTWPER